MEGEVGTMESLSTSRMDDDEHSLLTADVDEGKGMGIDQLEEDEEEADYDEDDGLPSDVEQ